VSIIKIQWQGPYTLEEIKELKKSLNRGVYQVYGPHTIFGPDSLLYVGKASKKSFAKVISKKLDTFPWMSAPSTRFYVGKVGLAGTKIVSQERWVELIDMAERLITCHVAPPYNTDHLTDYGDIKRTIVLNYGTHHQLPTHISTFFDDFVADEP
ncbi:MAG: hypothetical protein AAF485_11590, partial [Chloroflexota bacterium]